MNSVNDLAQTDEEAECRFNKYKEKDPYPKISTSLLNSADILAYVKAVSLIFPFDEKCLQGASYDVKIKGEVIYWDEKGKENDVILSKEGEYFNLRPNSIAFVTLEPKFRIPYYLALRFNLKITHIYKGLLLGTGPLVDPGFVGELSIPLHNLTSNTYRFSVLDELITMEFTKMSSNKIWVKNAPNILENYKPNKIPKNRTVREYIIKALGKNYPFRIISSIPKAMLESQKKVEKSEKAVEDVKKVANLQVGISIIAVIALVATCFGISLSALFNANERYDTLIEKFNDTISVYERKIDELNGKIEELKKISIGNQLSQQSATEHPAEKTDD